MATRTRALRFALRAVPEPDLPDGAWWPRSRQLSHEIAQLCALWPFASGRILRVHYAASDWDDHPGTVAIPGRRVKAECSADGDGTLVLVMGGGARRTLALISPDAASDVAAGVLRGVGSVAHSRPVPTAAAV